MLNHFPGPVKSNLDPDLSPGANRRGHSTPIFGADRSDGAEKEQLEFSENALASCSIPTPRRRASASNLAPLVTIAVK